MIGAMTSVRGAEAAPATSERLGPTAAIGRLLVDPNARLLGSGDRGVVGIAASPTGGWMLTTLAQPTSLTFASPIEAVDYAVTTLGVEAFTSATSPRATPPPGRLPYPAMPAYPSAPTYPTTPSRPGASAYPTPAQPQYPLTTADAAAALASGARILEGRGSDGRTYTLYGLNLRSSGGSVLEGQNRGPADSRAGEVGGRTDDGDAVVRTQTSYRVGTWWVEEGDGGPDHAVRSSQAGLAELVVEHGVTSFRIPPPAT